MRKFWGLLLQLNMLYNACRYGLLSAQPADMDEVTHF